MYIDKDMLKEHARHRRELKNEELRYGLVAPKVQSPSSGDGMPRGNNTIDTTYETVIGITDIEKNILRLRKVVEDEAEEIKKVIDALKNPNEKIVLRLKYIDLREWEDIRGLLFGRKKDYYDNLDKYIDKAYRLHGNALNHIRDMQNNKT